ncbi:unnamed protein product, partial [Rotaria magnacalcarata]
ALIDMIEMVDIDYDRNDSYRYDPNNTLGDSCK